MKKVLVAMAFFFAFSLTTVSAQDAAKPKKQQFAWNKMYMDEIGISDDVQAKIEVLKKENDLELKAVRENTSLSSEEKKTQLQQISVKRQKIIIALLTPEEIGKFREIVARIKAHNESIKE